MTSQNTIARSYYQEATKVASILAFDQGKREGKKIANNASNKGLLKMDW